MTTKTTFDTYSADLYEFTHGHRPRGEGTWIFDLGRNGAWTQTSYYGSYGRAKQQAIIEARQLGCHTVRVCT